MKGRRTWERSEPMEGVARSWHVEPGPASEPDTLWLGGDPGTLLRSDDGGRTWATNAGIAEHPTRDRWQPGAGGLCCHSIRSPPTGRCTWRSRRPARSGRTTAARPGGRSTRTSLRTSIPRSTRGESWQRLDGNGLPSSFGFGIALDPGDPDVAYVIPEEGAEYRVTAEGRLGVYRTGDGGATWEQWSAGLPEHAWTGVLREAMSFDADGVYFGTQSGSLFGSADGSWRELASQLPPVLSVEAAAV